VLVDMKGNPLGINIARHHRTTSYTIPSTRIASVLKKLMPKNSEK